MGIAEKLAEIYENVPKVYDAGYDSGEKGQREAFWNEFIGEGKPMLYAFAGYTWTDKNFRPTRNIVASAESAERMFYVSRLTNIKDSLEKCGVTLDLSQATSMNGAFLYASTRELPALDLSGATNIGNCFNSCSSLTKIESVKFASKVSNCSNIFAGSVNIVEIRIDGTIDFAGLDFSPCKQLSAESLGSIIGALNVEVTGSITLPVTAEGTYNYKYGSGTWNNLTNQFSRWTIYYK